MSVQQQECESTIKIIIDQSEYDSNVLFKNIDIIFIFANDTRLHSRTIEKKTTTKKSYVLSSYNNVLFPIKRTISTETVANISSLEVKKVIFRKILYHENNIRISCNKEQNDFGIAYSYAGEVEYSKNYLYSVVCKLETDLMGLMHKWQHLIKFDKLTTENIFSTCSTKLQPWTLFNPNEAYYWAYKWNGVKGKFFYNEKNIIIIPDVNDIKIIPNEDLSFLERMCFQIEILDDCLVIVELISCMYTNKLFISEPNTNIKYLDHLEQYLLEKKIEIDGKKLLCQKFFLNNLPSVYDNNIHDGFIIAQNNRLIKIKHCTFDAKYLGNNVFLVDQNKLITNIFFQPEMLQIQNAIYEIGPNFTILRIRNDRIAPSTIEEYNVYIESFKFLKY